MKNPILKFIMAFLLAVLVTLLLWKALNTPDPVEDPKIQLTHDIDSAKKLQKTDEQIIKEIYSGPDLNDREQDSLISAYRKRTAGH